MIHKKGGKTAIFLLLIIGLNGCGGAGGDTTSCQSTIPGLCASLSAPLNGGDLALTPVVPEVSAEGVYGGVLAGSKSRDFVSIILENGEYWTIYGNNSITSFQIVGIMQGSLTSSKGQFASGDIKDFGFSPALAGTASASHQASTNTISGTVRLGSTNIEFSGGPIAGSPYNYNAAASLATVSGLWSTTILTGEKMTLAVAATGEFKAISALGCNLSGTIRPRLSGKNVFDVSVNLGPAPCVLPNHSGKGIAIAYQLASGKTQLLITTIDSSRNYGTAVFGTR